MNKAYIIVILFVIGFLGLAIGGGNGLLSGIVKNENIENIIGFSLLLIAIIGGSYIILSGLNKMSQESHASTSTSTNK